MKINIHELAVKEFNEAIEWYELQSNGLGNMFKKSVIKQIQKIKQNPVLFLVEAENIHKAYVPKFPDKGLFTSSRNYIVIWSIAHMHRKPLYWQSRMN